MGEDAIWIQEEGSAGSFGHSGLLVQNAKGEWFFFYWGAKPGASAVEMVTGTEAMMVFVKVDTNGLDMKNGNHIRKALKQTDKYFGDDPRSGKVTDLYYFEGDYSKTHKHLQNMYDSPIKEQYSVIYRNCLQQTRKALAKSNIAIPLMTTSVIPNLAYKELFIWNELLDEIRVVYIS